MSNILKTSQNIKKKLSLADYAPSVQQPTVEAKPVSQPESAIMPAPSTGQPDTSHRQPVSHTPASRHDMSCNGHHTCGHASKVKVTFYLTDEDNQALMDLYIHRLQHRRKTDKSAIVAEAIRALYERELK